MSMSIPARRLSQIQALLPGNVLLAVVAVVWLCAARGSAQQQVDGMRVIVPNPITTDAVKAIEADITPRIAQNSARHVSTLVFDFNPDGKPAQTASLGACLDLQTLIQRVQQNHGVNTVAYVHNKVSGHTVLPALACRELVMSKNAEIGQVAADAVDPLDDRKKGFYTDAPPADRRSVLGPVIRKMFDPDVKLMKGISKKTGAREFADARDPQAMQNLAGAVPVSGTQDGQVALYNSQTALDLGLCQATVKDLEDLAGRYDLPPAAIIVDPLGGRTPDVYRWVLKGDIDAATRDSLTRVIRDVRRKQGNVLILVINAGGKDLDTARAIADDLRAAQTGEDAIKIVAFIPTSAPAAGTVVALGCSEIVMYRPGADAGGEAKEAEIGDFSSYLKGAKPADINAALISIRELAEQQHYPAILIDGMFDKAGTIEIVRANKRTTANRKHLMTREQFDRENESAKQAAPAGGTPDLWIQDKVIKPKGQPLKLNATLAAEVGLARTLVEGTDAKAVSTTYGWNEPKDPDPGWLDKFAEFLRMPVVTVLIVVIGFTGLILELKVPGLTVPGIIAALCFILVFWAHSKFSGQTFVLALLLFLLGLVLVGLEIFVLPGFGACGIFGILCMLAGLGLVTLDKIPQTPAEWSNLGVRVSQYLFAMMGAMALAFTIAKFLPKLPGANRLVLDAPQQTGSPADALPGAGEAAELLGAIGTTSTPLRPAGVVKFGDKFVDVVSDGGFIPAGTRVQVIQVEGTRIVVKEV
jgi:membrane-bound ClpP family serine protease